MNRDRIYRVACILAVGILLASAYVAQAGTLYYSGASTYNKGWDNGITKDWSSTSAGTAMDSYWADGDDAYFTGTAGTVNITDPSGMINSVNSITFNKTNFTISGGTITLTGAGGSITTLSTYAATISSTITGNVGLTKGGTSASSSLTLTGTNTYTGGTTINIGTLNVGINGSAGGTLGSGAISDSGTLLFATSTPTTVNDSISGGGGIKVQFGNVTLGYAANSFTGAVSVVGNGTGPTLAFSSALNLGIGSQILIGNDTSGYGATLAASTTGAVTLSQSIVLGPDTSTSGHWQDIPTISVTNSSGTLTCSGVISTETHETNTQTLTKTGAGTLVFTNANTYNGTTIISAGTLQIGNGGTSGTLGSAGVTDSSALVFNRSDNYGGAVSNAISGTGSLTVSAGALTLSGINGYTGATIVKAGMLYLSGGSISTSSDIQVADGATYQVLVSANTSLSLYSRLATTNPTDPNNANALNLVGAVINQNVNYTLGGSNVTMAWRARTNPEVALGLASDVMTLGGITAGTPYVVDMYYNPASLLGPGATLAYDPSPGAWYNAVDGNSGNNASGGELGYVGSFANFQLAYGTTISNYVGAYGYDPSTDQAWAVVNQAGGTFAVVPEPGALVLLTVGLLGMVAAYGWRKRK